MIRRRQIALLDVVAGAGLVDAALQIDAEPVHHVAGPAAAFAAQFQLLFGGEHAAVALAVAVEQEVALLAEQPEPVADLPGNLDMGIRRRRAGIRRRVG